MQNGSGLARVLKNLVHRPVKKVPGARRARNRRAEAYLGSTLERLCLERNCFPQRSIATILNACFGQAGGRWAFFNGLLQSHVLIAKVREKDG